MRGGKIRRDARRKDQAAYDRLRLERNMAQERRSLEVLAVKGDVVSLRTAVKARGGRVVGYAEFDFPVFDEKLEALMAFLPAKEIYELVLDSYTIEARRPVHAEDYASRPAPENGTQPEARRADWQKVLFPK